MRGRLLGGVITGAGARRKELETMVYLGRPAPQEGLTATTELWVRGFQPWEGAGQSPVAKQKCQAKGPKKSL